VADPDRGADSSDRGLAIRAARGAASNYAGQFVVLAAAILLTPVILHSVGEAAYSLWVLANALTGYGGLLDLGISYTVQKYVAEHAARGTLDELSRMISSALALYAGLGLVALVGFAGLAPLVPMFVDVRGDLHGVTVWLTVLVGAQVAVTLCAAMPRAILRGAQRFEQANALVIVGTVLTAGLTVLVLALGAGIVAVAAVGVAVTVGMQLPSIWLVRRALPELHLHPGSVTAARVRAVFSFSLWVFARRFADILTRRTDPIVIGAALPVRMITPFALAQRLPEAASILTNQFVQVLLPLASDLDARRERATVRALYLGSTRISIAFAVVIGTTIAVLGPSILDVWVGDEYSRYGVLVTILATAAIVDTADWAAVSILTSMGRHRPLAWMALGGGLVKVVLSVILVFPFGLTGVAVATLVPAAVETVFLVIPYSLRTLGIRGSAFVAHVVVPNLLPAAVVTVVLVAARMILDTDRPAILLGTIVVALVAYCATYVRFSAGATERQFYRSLRATAWSSVTGAARR
jgi:O-antigen/teichoic acid export membrane protein